MIPRGGVYLALAGTFAFTWAMGGLPIQGRTPSVSPLQDHPSPYLAMHASDPVHWRLWGPDVLQDARKDNRLIFVSSGYFSCHWCHVMHRESFTDGEVAEALGRFISVKVDRELEPTLDAQLIDFVRTTRGYAGWPLNVVLTPRGQPIIGFVYLPREDLLGVLREVDRLWKERPRDICALADNYVRGRVPTAPDKAVRRPLEPLGERLNADAAALFDDEHAGFGQQSKFPRTPQLRALLSLYRAQPEASLGHVLTATLDQMAGGGLRDHLAGGFFRYTVDPAWQTPHFEKMLPDNAQLADLYLQAAATFHRADYREVGLETLAFLVRELSTADGGFAASLSAMDAHGDEGAPYLWDRDTLKTILTPAQFQLIEATWDLNTPSVHDAGYLPSAWQLGDSLAIRLGVNKEELANLTAETRAILLDARRAKSVPRDEKQIAGWNGLALGAFASAARLPDMPPQWREVCERLEKFIVGRLWRDGRLWRAYSDGRTLSHAATLADYAYVGWGLARWAEAKPAVDSSPLRATLIRQAWRLFYRSGQWQLAEQLPLPLATPQAVLEDGALPSPAAVLITVTLTDPAATFDLKATARKALTDVLPVIAPAPFLHASLVRATFDQLPNPWTLDSGTELGAPSSPPYRGPSR